ncbi:hypothetical protein BKA67DRAFT_557633 [Truncatella angustata]|uniref:Uncharacterized protein n=1 Tax=Truncatella angustata TaxID=152316 RepID=A0A9P8UUH1_9PEZI|nr:uncharacterized protein BKA67DRAFT_557633 [Truncatella angustata]KAH6658297.1 hypothetical protein BKA67DRAFT_557633 [Truncatella angustata]
MAGKHDTTKPSWLSGLVTRRGSGKNKKVDDSTDEKSSVFKFKRQKKSPAQESTLSFKPLEVDLKPVEAYKLADGWLEPEPRKSEHEQEKQQAPAAVPEDTTTPIAAMFASMSALNILESGQPRRSSSHNRGTNSIRPGSVVENQINTHTRPLAEVATIRLVPSEGSVLNRGRPVEPKHFVTDPLRDTKSSRQEDRPQSSASVAVPKELRRKPVQFGNSGLSTATKQIISSQRQPQVEYDPFNDNNRHSMYAGAAPSSSDGGVKSRPAPLRSASATPLDRIQAWQKTVTSAPNSAASTVSRFASLKTLTPTVPSQTAPSVRKISPRGGAGNRLAWIRELEEKNSSSVSRDMGVLKKQKGSVSDKLAMFEKQGQGAAPASRLPPLTRSNSTTSRLSSVGLESTFSVANTSATPRTSIDTVRSSHRASSVMNYYDDGFREKMETVVSGYADKDKPDVQKKQRVTTQFISVEPVRGGAETPSHPSQAGSASSNSGKEVDEESDRESRKELMKEIENRCGEKEMPKEVEKETQEETERISETQIEMESEKELSKKAVEEIGEKVAEEAEEEPTKQVEPEIETETEKKIVVGEDSAEESEKTPEISRELETSEEPESLKESDIPGVSSGSKEVETSNETGISSDAVISPKSQTPQQPEIMAHIETSQQPDPVLELEK